MKKYLTPFPPHCLQVVVAEEMLQLRKVTRLTSPRLHLRYKLHNNKCKVLYEGFSEAWRYRTTQGSAESNTTDN